MKSSLRLLLIVSFALAAVLPAHASFYYKVGGLYASPADISISSASAFKGSLKNDVGVTGALGYKFPLLPVRAEAEVQYFNTRRH